MVLRSQERTRTEDAGVIAIVVALAVSTFLLGFAALAVDLGSAYVRKAELQSVANRLALAGAKGLPDMVRDGGAIDQINQTLQQICRSSPLPGVCTADNNAPDPSWMTDGDPGNGEVTFYSDTNGDTEYSLSDRVSDLATTDVATALRVKLAPSTVDFGLAGAIGTDSATLTKSASGRVGTPIGAGILPFALQQGDLDQGQFCVRDPAFPLNPTPPAPTPRFWPVNLTFPPDGAGDTQYPGGVPPNTPNLTMRIRLTYPPTTGTTRLSNVVFHFTNSLEPFPLTGTATREPGGAGGEDIFVVTLPEGAPGTTAQVWATGRERIPGRRGTTNFVSSPGTIFYSGVLPPSADICQQASSERGFVDLARPGSGEQLDNLENNIRSSPAVNLFPVDGLLGTIGSDLDCVATAFSSPATTCLSTVTGTEFDDAFTDGFLRSSGHTSGRLVGNCGNGETSNNVDASRLFADPGFIDTSKGGSADALRNRLLGPGGATEPDPTNRGWLTGHVLECPRLAVMPIVDPDSLVGSISGKNITGFSYVWIDDDLTSTGRGLHFTRGQVDSFRGYVIDPGYLPATVAGSKLLGPFLGDDMPKQVRLIPDLGGSPS